jgi:hypothetical protein
MRGIQKRFAADISKGNTAGVMILSGPFAFAGIIAGTIAFPFGIRVTC